MLEFFLGVLAGGTTAILSAFVSGPIERWFRLRSLRAASLIDLSTSTRAFDTVLAQVRTSADIASEHSSGDTPPTPSTVLAKLRRMNSAFVIDTPQIDITELAAVLPPREAAVAMRAYDRRARFLGHAEHYARAFDTLLRLCAEDSDWSELHAEYWDQLRSGLVTIDGLSVEFCVYTCEFAELVITGSMAASTADSGIGDATGGRWHRLEEINEYRDGLVAVAPSIRARVDAGPRDDQMSSSSHKEGEGRRREA